MPAGCRVLIPRAEGGTDTLVELVAAAGGDPDAVALLEIGPPTDAPALDAAIVGLATGDYGWVGFTSAHGVTVVLDRARTLGLTPAVPTGTRVAAVGAATAAALRTADLPVDLVPAGGGSGAALAAAWPAPTGPARVLLPASEIGLTTLADALSDMGYDVDRVAAYAPRPLPVPDDVAADLRTGRYDAVLLTAPSLAGLIAGAAPHPTVLMIAIGATTAAAAADLGLTVAAVADEPTPAGLTAAWTRAIAADRSPPTAPLHAALPHDHRLSRNETP